MTLAPKCHPFVLSADAANPHKLFVNNCAKAVLYTDPTEPQNSKNYARDIIHVQTFSFFV